MAEKNIYKPIKYKVDKIVEDQEKESQEISEETITEDVLQIESISEIVLKPKAYLKLAKHALTFANDSIPKKNWVEVIGLLTGKIRDEETAKERAKNIFDPEDKHLHGYVIEMKVID